ncbi:MAG TPA: capsular biosynthesis protein [Brevundimonas sp.]|uniref:capsular polysaccharide export protein, LipB/KpsS family n=1 Tax=Brevundimonas sp. TaxID=1871086 RepID=UPI002DF3E5C8|nr:capsular biosynthesis protein [Brevundimonas sp.]
MRRRFLLVNLPYGPFGRELADALRARGAEVGHMVFNAGDLIDRRGPGGIEYRGRPEEWPATWRALAPAWTDVVVYGEGRWQARAVLDTAGSRPRVWVLENGYFRPDWVTLERDAVAADSPVLPRSAAAYAGHSSEAPEPEPVGPVTRPLVTAVARYWLAEHFLPIFPRHDPGFEAPPWRQAAGHLARWIRLRVSPPVDPAGIAAKGPFFLACLQREGDTQLTRHSDLKTNAAFIDRVVGDFAASSPTDVRLVIKNHPLDPAVIDQGRSVRRAAARHAVADRVEFIDGGALAPLCRASRGLVVNNSSSALAALGFGTPVKVLGRAFFDFEGLSDQKALSDFWSAPTPPDPDLFLRFRAAVIERTQINGSFEGPRLRASTARRVAERMMA